MIMEVPSRWKTVDGHKAEITSRATLNGKDVWLGNVYVGNVQVPTLWVMDTLDNPNPVLNLATCFDGSIKTWQ